MTAIRVTESTGSKGTIQVSDGTGGFLSGTIVAGNNVTIADNGSGSFTVTAATSGTNTIGDAEDGSYTERGGQIIGHTPMNRFGKPEELAGVVTWLACRRAASFVTGQNIAVDGGFASVTI